MKELLEKFGLADLFAFLSPGALLLCSLRLWIDPKVDLPDSFRPDKESWEAFLLAVFLVILAYTLGLIVALWSSGGAAHYLRQVNRYWYVPWKPRPFKMRYGLGVPEWLCMKLLRLLHGPYVLAVGLLHWLPDPRMDRELWMRASVRIAEGLRTQSGAAGISNEETPWDWLALYRVVVSDTLGEKAKVLLAEAETIHRRFLFCMGISLVATLIALQSLLRLALLLLPAIQGLPTVSGALLLAIAVLAAATSFGLRWSSSRWWQSQFLLTCALCQRAAPAKSPPAPWWMGKQ